MPRLLHQRLALLLSLGAFLAFLAMPPPLNGSSPPGGTHSDGDLWVAVSGQNLPTSDDLIGTQSLGYASATVWRYSGYYHSWQYAPAGTAITFSCSPTQPSGWDDTWSALNGSNAGGPSVTVQVGANGATSTAFYGVADTADRLLEYSADAGAKQLNRNETVYAAGGGALATLWHSHFLATDSHAVAVYPPEGFNVSYGSIAPVWDGQLQGHTPDANHKFQLLAEIYSQAGDPLWNSDNFDRYSTADADQRLFASSGAHLTDMVPAWDRPVPSLAAYAGQNVLLVVSIEESDYSPLSGWSTWTTIKTAGGADVKAERTFHLVP